ncbi:MAG: zinc transporter ZntB [Alphaproteobacteria bacterium]|nr:zinc transporter ZntB [Alphaproteobacteria bacterium]
MDKGEDRGLICAYLLDGKGSGKPLGWREIEAWTPDKGALWIHLNRTVPHVEAWLRSGAGLEPEIHDALLEANVRPRMVAMSKGLLVNLRGINFNQGSDPEDMVAVRVYVEGPRIITTRNRRAMAIQDMRDRLAAGKGPRDPSDCLLLIATGMLQRVGDVLSELADTIDDLEDALLDGRTRQLRQRLAKTRRRAIAIRRHLAPQREALLRMQTEGQVVLDEKDRMVCRELADATTRYIEELDSVRERSQVIQDERMNRVAEAQSRNSYLLTVIAAVALPLTLITSILGVNIGGMHEGQADSDFWMLVYALGGAALAQILIFRLSGWF